MKILQAIASVDSKWGGPIESLKQISPLIEKMGHSCEVVSLDSPDAGCVKDFPLPLHALGPGFGFYEYSSRFVPWLKRHRNDYDCVIVRGLWRYNSFGVWRALQKTNTPYYVFTHGMLDPWFRQNYPLKHLKKYLYWPWGEYRVLRDARAVLFTSEEEKILARESFKPYSCNEVVVAYGTNGPTEDRQTLRTSFFEKHPDLEGKHLILFLGRIHEKKGCDLLIDAFGTVARERPDLQLVVVGPDQEGLQSTLVAQAHQIGVADKITWTGMLAGDEKWEAFAAANVFMLPSHQENFGISVAEALACETPVLISNKVNIWREIQRSDAGLVAADTVRGTAKILNDWLNLETQEQLEMQQKARTCFEQNFEASTAARGLLNVLEADFI